jgi:hypothetical protein
MHIEKVSNLRPVFALIASMLTLAAAVTGAGQQTGSVVPAPEAAPELKNLPPPVVDPKAQQLLDKLIATLGGPVFLNFKTLTTKGRTFSIEDEQTVGLAPYQSLIQYPEKRRFVYGTKQPVTLINDGDQGWEIDRYGIIKQQKKEVARWRLLTRYSLENLLRLRIHEPSMLIQMGGVDFVNNVPARIIEMTDGRHTHLKLFLNRQTLLPVEISYTLLNPDEEEQDEYADMYGDYQVRDGIQTPMHVTRFLNGERVNEIYRNFVQYNETYPPDSFQNPMLAGLK